MRNRFESGGQQEEASAILKPVFLYYIIEK